MVYFGLYVVNLSMDLKDFDAAISAAEARNRDHRPMMNVVNQHEQFNCVAYKHYNAPEVGLL